MLGLSSNLETRWSFVLYHLWAYRQKYHPKLRATCSIWLLGLVALYLRFEAHTDALLLGQMPRRLRDEALIRSDLPGFQWCEQQRDSSSQIVPLLDHQWEILPGCKDACLAVLSLNPSSSTTFRNIYSAAYCQIRYTKLFTYLMICIQTSHIRLGRVWAKLNITQSWHLQRCWVSFLSPTYATAHSSDEDNVFSTALSSTTSRCLGQSGQLWRQQTRSRSRVTS